MHETVMHETATSYNERYERPVSPFANEASVQTTGL